MKISNFEPVKMIKMIFIWRKNNANWRKENLFSICRVQFIFCKDSANKNNGKKIHQKKRVSVKARLYQHTCL